MPLIIKSNHMSSFASKPLATKQGGATLIETLVSLMILAVGLLGILSMQANSVKSNQRSQFASEAFLLASDMIDRIYAYDDVTDPDDNDDFDDIDTNDDTAMPTCLQAGCNAASQVDLAKAEWRQAFRSRLPSGRGTVNYINGVYTVAVMWDNDNTGATGTGCSGDSDTDLACYIFEVAL